MAKNSSIEWTDHTFNPWWGCAKVSPGCVNCYAETWAKRVGANVWGEKSERRFFGDKHWSEPKKWNADAGNKGIRSRVFCASMADVFEGRDDLNGERRRLWNLISITPHLDWLLLTKRPQNIEAMVPWSTSWPSNVWLGTTVEDQQRAIERLPHLLKHPARRRFLSCEPLIGSVNLSTWISGSLLHPIDWVIAGGESGAKARVMLPQWARNLRDQCSKAGIPFHFKQWGHWAPSETDPSSKAFWDNLDGRTVAVKMAPKGKKQAGRTLDGETWDQLPAAA